MEQPKFTTGTSVKDGLIVNEVDYHDGMGRTQNLITQTLNTSETHVREALIQMGWAPPEAVARSEREHTKTIEDRDHWHDKATELANDVGNMLGFDVGEHSSSNCPVQSAIDGVFEMAETVKAALPANAGVQP